MFFATRRLDLLGQGMTGRCLESVGLYCIRFLIQDPAIFLYLLLEAGAKSLLLRCSCVLLLWIFTFRRMSGVGAHCWDMLSIFHRSRSIIWHSAQSGTHAPK